MMFSALPPTFKEDVDSENILSLSSPTGVAHSAAEKAREKKLRDDPMAIVLGPLYVDCKRCGSRIKLSSKSLYDAFHWRTHRSRCLKRQPDKPKKQRLKTDLASLSKQSQSPETPPLIADNDDETTHINSISSMNEDIPSPYCPTTPPQSRSVDLVFEEYLLRSNRKKQPTLSKPPASWKDWSWSQLLLPQFTQQASTDPSDGDGLFITDSMTEVELHPISIPILSQVF